MNPTDISKILDILVERLGPMGQATWETMLRQVQVSTITNLAWGLLCGLGMLVLTVLTIGNAVHESNKEYNQEYALAVFLGVLAGCLAIPAAVCLTTAYQRFANPAYYAIQLLLGR